MRKIFAFMLASFVASGVSMAFAADTCSACGMSCGRSADNCMISQDG